MALTGWWFSSPLLAVFHFGIARDIVIALRLDDEAFGTLIYSGFFLIPAGIFLFWMWLLLYPSYKRWKMKKAAPLDK